MRKRDPQVPQVGALPLQATCATSTYGQGLQNSSPLTCDIPSLEFNFLSLSVPLSFFLMHWGLCIMPWWAYWKCWALTCGPWFPWLHWRSETGTQELWVQVLTWPPVSYVTWGLWLNHWGLRGEGFRCGYTQHFTDCHRNQVGQWWHTLLGMVRTPTTDQQ